MKRCPQCNRRYKESFSFCLDDGATLHAVVDRDAPTEILPVGQWRLNMKRRRYRLFLFGIGVLLLLGGVVGLIASRRSKTVFEGIFSSTPQTSSKPSVVEPTMRTYFDYITLEPGQYPAGMNCHVIHHVALLFEAPEGQQAVYRGRIKSRGRTELDSNPSHIVRNPDQWRDNPTYLEFSIQDKPQPGSSLDIEAVASEDTIITRELGWIGSHLPYRTEYAVIIIDYSQMKFNNFPRDVQGLVEFRGADGSNHTENLNEILHPRVQDDTIILMRRNLPAESSIVLKWGTQQ